MLFMKTVLSLLAHSVSNDIYFWCNDNTDISLFRNKYNRADSIFMIDSYKK